MARGASQSGIRLLICACRKRRKINDPLGAGLKTQIASRASKPAETSGRDILSLPLLSS